MQVDRLWRREESVILGLGCQEFVVGASLFLCLNTVWKFCTPHELFIFLNCQQLYSSLLLIQMLPTVFWGFFQFYCLIFFAVFGEKTIQPNFCPLNLNVSKFMLHKPVTIRGGFEFVPSFEGQGRVRREVDQRTIGGREFEGVSQNGTWPGKNNSFENFFLSDNGHCETSSKTQKLLLVLKYALSQSVKMIYQHIFIYMYRVELKF